MSKKKPRRPPCPADGMLSQDAVLRDIQQRQVANDQERMVDLMLSRFKLRSRRQEMLQESRERLGSPQLNFELFHEFFPGFPLTLRYMPAKNLRKRCTLTMMFLDFSGLVTFHAYQEAVADNGGEPVGLVFKWPNLPHGLILRESSPELSERRHGTFVYVTEDEKIFCLEPFSRYLDSLSDWRPEE